MELFVSALDTIYMAFIGSLWLCVYGFNSLTSLQYALGYSLLNVCMARRDSANVR